MRNVLAAMIGVVMALSFSAGSAAEVPIYEYDARGIYSDIEVGTRSERNLFTVRNFRENSSDATGTVWVCDFVEKSTGNSDARIVFSTNVDARVVSLMVVSRFEVARHNENLAEAIITFTFALTAYFGLDKPELQALAADFMENPGAGEWKTWDSARRKCVHVVPVRDGDVVGFAIYATDGE